MKKTFRSILAGALALLAVSCYDDSALRNALASLESRVAELETKLNTEVGTLNSKFDGLEVAYKLADQNLSNELAALKTSVTASLNTLTQRLDALDGALDGYVTLDAYNASQSDYTAYKATLEQKITELLAADKKLSDDFATALEELRAADTALGQADALLKQSDESILAALVGVGVTNVAKNAAGNVVITFVDKSTLEIPTKPQEGLVTVVEVEGEKFWAVVVNGEKQNLGVKVGHPDYSIEFEVDYETNELLYSVNGGEFEPTGAFVATDQDYLLSDFYQGIAGYDEMTYEPIMNDYFTLVFGGFEYQLPVYKVDESVVTIKAGKTYFTYGESKTIDVVVSDITSMYVMTKPDGWKAKLNGNKLTVTAPSEANVTAEIAEAEGEVLLHCTAKNGGCKVAKLAVSTTGGFNLVVNADGTFTLTNPIVNVSDYEADFNDALIGLATIADFEKDPAAYVKSIASGDGYWDDIVTYVSNWKNNTMDWETYEYTIGGRYTPGEYEVDVINSSVADLYNNYTYNEIPRGSQFVVWSAPVDEQGVPTTDALVFGYYTPMTVAMEEAGEASFNEVPVSLELYGAEKFYVGHVAKEMCYNWNTEQYDLKEYLSMYISYLQYGVNYIGLEFAPGVHEVNLSELVNEMEEVTKLNPNTEYFAFVLPIISGKAVTDYSFDDVVSFEFKTNPLVAGGSASVDFTDAEISYTHITAEMTATEGTSMVYYNFYTSDAANALDDEAMIADLIENGYIFSGNLGEANKDVNPGDEWVLAALAVDAEGMYGEVALENLNVPTITYSTTFVATVGTPEFTEYTQYGQTNYKVTVPVTVEGGEAAKYYYYWNTSARTEEQLQKLPLGSKGYYYYLNSTTAPKDLVFYKSSTSYQYAVVVESTTGELSNPVIITVNNPDNE